MRVPAIRCRGGDPWSRNFREQVSARAAGQTPTAESASHDGSRFTAGDSLDPVDRAVERHDLACSRCFGLRDEVRLGEVNALKLVDLECPPAAQEYRRSRSIRKRSLSASALQLSAFRPHRRIRARRRTRQAPSPSAGAVPPQPRQRWRVSPPRAGRRSDAGSERWCRGTRSVSPPGALATSATDDGVPRRATPVGWYGHRPSKSQQVGRLGYYGPGALCTEQQLVSRVKPECIAHALGNRDLSLGCDLSSRIH